MGFATDADIQRLCCIIGKYTQMASIQVINLNGCGGNEGSCTCITSVVASTAGPYGLDEATGILTIPDGGGGWLTNGDWQSLLNLLGTGGGSGDPNMRTFRLAKQDGTFLEFPVFKSSVDTYRNDFSFEHNGVGMEIMYSSHVGNALPASPQAATAVPGTRFYSSARSYLYFDEAVGRITHWWNPAEPGWFPVMTRRNVLRVGTLTAPHATADFDFATITAAYAYLAALPVSADAQDPNQRFKPTQLNQWFLLIDGSCVEPGQIDVVDWVNIVFTERGLVTNINNTKDATFLFDGAAAHRTSAGNVNMRMYGPGNSLGYAQIQRQSNVASASETDAACAVRIKDAWRVNIQGLRIDCIMPASGGYGMHIYGSCVDSTDTANTAKKLIFRDLRVSGIASTAGSNMYALYMHQSAGFIQFSNCVFRPAFGTGTLGNAMGARLNHSGGIVEFSKCEFSGARTGTSMGVWIATASATPITRFYDCEMTCYGDASGYSNAALHFAGGGTTEVVGCTIMARPYVIGGAPNSATAALAACVAAVNINAVNANLGSITFEQCRMIGEGAAAVGFRIEPGITSVDAKVTVAQCTIRGGLGSVHTNHGANTGRFVMCYLNGAIIGAFSPVAATATYQTNYRL